MSITLHGKADLCKLLQNMVLLVPPCIRLHSFYVLGDCVQLWNAHSKIMQNWEVFGWGPQVWLKIWTIFFDTWCEYKRLGSQELRAVVRNPFEVSCIFNFSAFFRKWAFKVQNLASRSKGEKHGENINQNFCDFTLNTFLI